MLRFALAAVAALIPVTALAVQPRVETPELDNSKTSYCVQMIVRQGPVESGTYKVVSERCWVGSFPTLSTGETPSLSERKSKN